MAFGGHHPDANLLTAFAENALTETERTRVMHHLTHCVDCREVAAFVPPEDLAPAESAETPSNQRLSPWPILRWGALAAMMAALAIVITVHPNLWQHHENVATNVPPARPAGNIQNPPVAVSSLPASPRAERMEPLRILSAPERSSQANAIKRSVETEQEFSQNARALQAPARQQVTTLASTQPPAPIQSAPETRNVQSSGGAANGLIQAAPPASDFKVAPQQSENAPAAQQVSTSAFQAGQQKAELSGAVAAKAAPQEATEDATSLQKRKSSLSAQQTAGAQASPTAANAFLSRAAATSNEPASAGVRWLVTPEGKILRTTKAGDAFEAVSIAYGIKFSAVASLGNDVWAGGEGGALYHSTDRGATWTRVAVSPDGNKMNEAVTSIQIRDGRHVTVTTATGSQYESDDSGQHWRYN